MILTAIAAMARNRVIGRNNQLPWNLPGDWAHFKNRTKGHVMIMGRKTFESLPKPLAGRLHIVVTRRGGIPEVEGSVVLVSSLEQALQRAIQESQSGQWPEEVFMCGGGELYTQSIPFWDRLSLTVVDADIEGDAYFPAFDLSLFHELSKVQHQETYPYSIFEYQRKPRT